MLCGMILSVFFCLQLSVRAFNVPYTLVTGNVAPHNMKRHQGSAMRSIESRGLITEEGLRHQRTAPLWSYSRECLRRSTVLSLRMDSEGHDKVEERKLSTDPKLKIGVIKSMTEVACPCLAPSSAFAVRYPPQHHGAHSPCDVRR
eukprot:769519-Rhodomonas_salina.1